MNFSKDLRLRILFAGEKILLEKNVKKKVFERFDREDKMKILDDSWKVLTVLSENSRLHIFLFKGRMNNTEDAFAVSNLQPRVRISLVFT